MYYIDSPTKRIDVLDYDAATGEVEDRRPFAVIEDGVGVPDGLALDVEDGVWVALYGGAQVRRYGPGGTLDAVHRGPRRQRDRAQLRRRGRAPAVHHHRALAAGARRQPVRGRSGHRRAAGRAVRGIARHPAGKASGMNVLIASPLGPRSSPAGSPTTDERIELTYLPELLPRRAGTGRRRRGRRRARRPALGGAAAARGGRCSGSRAAGRGPRRPVRGAPALRWVQARNAGAGQQLARALRLAPGELERVVVTTSSGVHAGPLAEFALFGLLAFAKDLPTLLADQRERHWPPRPAARRRAARPHAADRRRSARSGPRPRGSRRRSACTCWRSSATRPARPPTSTSSTRRRAPRARRPGRRASSHAAADRRHPRPARRRHARRRQARRRARQRRPRRRRRRGRARRAPPGRHPRRRRARRLRRGAAPARQPAVGARQRDRQPAQRRAGRRRGGALVDLFCDNLRRRLAGEPLRNQLDPEVLY